MVTSRLGYDPFGSSNAVPDHGLTVTIALEPDGFVGALRRAGGRRELPPTERCSEAVATLAAAVAIQLDPLAGLPSDGAGEESAISEPVGSAPRGPSTSVGAAPSPPPPEATAGGGDELDLRFEAVLALGAALGLAPLPTPTAQLAAGLGTPTYGFEIGGRVSTTFAPVELGGRDTMLTLATASFAGCARFEGLSLCGLGEVGGLFADAQGLEGGDESAVYGSLGARVAYTFDLRGPLDLELRLRGFVPLTRYALVSEGADVWEASPVAGELAIAARLR